MCLCLLKVYQKLQKYPGVEKKKKKRDFRLPCSECCTSVHAIWDCIRLSGTGGTHWLITYVWPTKMADSFKYRIASCLFSFSKLCCWLFELKGKYVSFLISSFRVPIHLILPKLVCILIVPCVTSVAVCFLSSRNLMNNFLCSCSSYW